MSRAAPESRTWWISRRWVRVSVVVFFWAAVGLLVSVLLADDVRWQTLVSAVINPLVALGAWTTMRQRTQADGNGLRLVGPVRSRRISWSEVCEVTTTRARWGEHTLRVDLTDGTSVHPVGVPASVVHELETMRRRAGS